MKWIGAVLLATWVVLRAWYSSWLENMLYDAWQGDGQTKVGEVANSLRGYGWGSFGLDALLAVGLILLLWRKQPPVASAEPDAQ